MLVNVDYHLIDKCNLNCVGCNHFCPLVPENNKPKSIEQITADLALLSKFKDHLCTLGLLGGEPLLHPKLSQICRISREFFPNNEISITTNGILLNRIREIKDAVEEFNITLVVTVYPIRKSDPYYFYNEAKKIIPSTQAWAFPTENGMYINELTDDINVASLQEIKDCVKRWRCNQLKDGKLYICHYAAQLDYLKNAFPELIHINKDEEMYLDLNNDDLTIDDIYEFQRNTMPEICSHCSDAHFGGYAGPVQPWRQSEFKLTEWYK